MNNREWLYSPDVADLADWFDAEHVDANDVSTRKGDVRADDVCANDGFMDLDSCTHGVRTFASETDSREKLEADVRKWCAMMGMQPYQLDFVYGWLDRQAAITANETSHDNPYVGLVRGKQWERTERSDYYCGKCGWKVTDHNSYCPECGGALHRAPNKPDGKFDARKTAESAENVTSKNEIHNFDDSREQLEAEYAEPHKVNMKRYFKPFIEAAQRAIDVENDSREKLEDDVVHECARPGFGPEFGEIMAWLDRQAAIAERETKLRELYKFEENHRYHIRSIEEVNQKLNKRIAELTAERDALARDLAECDESRIEFRDQRDHAEEMLAQMERERDYWKLHADCWADKYKDMRTSRDCFKERAKRNEDKARNYQRQLSKAERYGTIWPRWEDGAPIEPPCAFEYMGNTERLQGIRFYSNMYVLEFTGIDHAKESFGIEYGTRHSRPPLIASDGKPILKGETLYGLSDSKAWTVTGFDRTRPWSVWAENDGGCKCLKPEWLAHEKPADGARAEKMAALEAENAELREKLGEAIGHAHEIGKLGDLELKVRVLS